MNIFLALVAVSQFLTWVSGPFSWYMLARMFIGLVFLGSGFYGIYKWKTVETAKKVLAVFGIVMGLVLLLEYEPIVGYLLR